MKSIYIVITILFCSLVELAIAQEQPKISRPDSHAPIGVMGDHIHKKGEWMLSYRYMHMQMKDNADGTDDLDPETIVTTIPNRFSGMPMQPPTLRVVPTEMTMGMHMIGLMYAPTDKLTLMAMTSFVQKEMSHITFQGGMGTSQLGTFTTETNGLGDTRISALVGLLAKDNHRLHINAGFSIPTGSITREDEILTPLETRPRVRLPYPMQLGSGTLDLLPGITYYSRFNDLGWGAQLLGTVRLGENAEEYRLGNLIQFTGWGSYQLARWISSGLRFTYKEQGKIEGIDPEIVAPVQTADPDFQGGTHLDGSISVNLIGQSGFIQNHRLAFEYGIPLIQELNGPQMKTKSTLILGWQYAF